MSIDVYKFVFEYVLTSAVVISAIGFLPLSGL